MTLSQTLRDAVAEHKMVKYKKQAIDVQTANAMLTVFDAMSEENQALFDSDKIPVHRLAKFCWGAVV